MLVLGAWAGFFAVLAERRASAGLSGSAAGFSLYAFIAAATFVLFLADARLAIVDRDEVRVSRWWPFRGTTIPIAEVAGVCLCKRNAAVGRYWDLRWELAVFTTDNRSVGLRPYRWVRKPVHSAPAAADAKTVYDWVLARQGGGGALAQQCLQHRPWTVSNGFPVIRVYCPDDSTLLTARDIAQSRKAERVVVRQPAP